MKTIIHTLKSIIQQRYAGQSCPATHSRRTRQSDQHRTLGLAPILWTRLMSERLLEFQWGVVVQS